MNEGRVNLIETKQNHEIRNGQVLRDFPVILVYNLTIWI